MKSEQQIREEVVRECVSRIRSTIIVDGESPEKLREAIAGRVADVGKGSFVNYSHKTTPIYSGSTDEKSVYE